MRKGTGAAAAVFGGVLVLAGGVGWLLYQAGKSDEDPAATGDGRTRPKRKGVKSQYVEPPPPDTVPKAKPPAVANVRFLIPGHDDLKLRNWREIAIVYREMTAVHRELLELGPPDPMNPKDAARLDKLSAVDGKYRAFLVDAPEGYALPPADLAPGTPPPPVPPLTPVLHPAFVVNLVAALLDRSAAPLTDDQARRLLDAGKTHSAVADRPEAPPTAEGWALERLAARAVVADNFYADVYSVLTTTQAEIVSPAGERGHAGMDGLSSAVVWSSMLRAMPFTDLDALIDEIADCLANSFNVPERKADLRPIVDAWARRSTFDAGDAAEIERGAVRAIRAQAAVKSTLDLLQHVLDDLKPPVPDVGRVTGVPIAFVPLRK